VLQLTWLMNIQSLTTVLISKPQLIASRTVPGTKELETSRPTILTETSLFQALKEFVLSWIL
jgi:hypothetical protein